MNRTKYTYTTTDFIWIVIDNQQITVSHFGEHKRLHLESSKQNYYIISLRAIIKAIFTSLDLMFTYFIVYLMYVGFSCVCIGFLFIFNIHLVF